VSACPIISGPIHDCLLAQIDDVEHHAEEEEEGKMFPKVRKPLAARSWKI